MSRRRLLSPLSLDRWYLRVVLFLSLGAPLLWIVPQTGANATLKVDEPKIKILLARDPVEVLLPVENLSRNIIDARIHLELLDPSNAVVAEAQRTESIQQTATISIPLPFFVSKLKTKERNQLPWLRLRYRITSEATTLAEGIASVSELAPELFEVRVAKSTYVQEGSLYAVRVQAFNPKTKLPAPGVRVRGRVTLQHNDNDIQLEAYGNTDSAGYVSLNFQIPERYPEFPHDVQTDGGELYVVAQRGALTAELTDDILVDQFAKILITTDKPIYQPGQTLHARALVYTPSRKPLINQEVFLKVRDYDDVIVFQTTSRTSRFGVVSTDWPIADNSKLGEYKISVGVYSGGDDDWNANTYVTVTRYDLPNFSVKVQPNQKYYLPKQNAEVLVNADYLFGRPVSRGHVRVVRETSREWNYKEQKWDLDEEESYEGELDASGNYVADVNLAPRFEELLESEYNKFRDLTFVAYVTDSSTNRTEQRRFDLRITKEPIHVYAVINQYVFDQTGKLPLEFFVSTFYADGSPARCVVDVKAAPDEGTPAARVRIRTNRYGFAKVSNLYAVRGWVSEQIDLNLVAGDVRGRKGTAKEEVRVDDGRLLTIRTAKNLYRANESITADIKSNFDSQPVIVELANAQRVLYSHRIKLLNNHAQVTFPYTADFKDKLSIVAYPDFPTSGEPVAIKTILYPENRQLKLHISPTQQSYRPGESATVDFRVDSPDKSLLESALGIAVVDRAVYERARTDVQSSSYYTNSLERFLGTTEQAGGVTINSLRRLVMSKPVPADLELMAEVVLQNSVYVPDFEEGESYETNESVLFTPSITTTLSPLKAALTKRYYSTKEYPREEITLRRLLSQALVDFEELRDPWGMRFQTLFTVDKHLDRMELKSTGPDKRPGTDDDFTASVFSWPYFQQMGEAIDRASYAYHRRTGAFIRDQQTLTDELNRDGIQLGSTRDRWGSLYRFNFNVQKSHYTIEVLSSGPDRRFQESRSWPYDDFPLWTSSIDYFAKTRAEISAALTRWTSQQKQFPIDRTLLNEALSDSAINLSALLDPWGQPYEPVFRLQTFYTDQVRTDSNQITDRSHTEVKPTTRNVRLLSLRSLGEDRKRGTLDDFDVATFTGVISEEGANVSVRTQVARNLVLAQGTGALAGFVTDRNGAVVARAKVSATFNEQSFETNTTDEGSFLITNLIPGKYSLVVEQPGFKRTTIAQVAVTALTITTINVAIDVGESMETVMVTSSAASVETTQIASLSAGRTFQQKITLVTKSESKQKSFTPRLREYFPETLLWQPELTTDNKGRARLNFKLGDNITTWKLSVIGSNKNGEVGTAETEIRAFQPFFAELDPPRVLTEGDRISLPVVLRNYLDRKQTVDLEIKPEGWFNLLDGNRKRVEVPPGDSAKETFDLQAIASIKDGKQRVTAIGSETSDAIEKPVTVHPDGEEKSVTTSDILTSSTSMSFNLPPEVIANSARVELKIYPNLMSHVWESVEGIMQRPYGCAEQTISSAYPSLLVLRFANEDHSSPVKDRARRYLEAGYQKLQNYQNEDGSFTYWGRGPGDIALTAYAIRFLEDSAAVVSIDHSVIDEARDWLIKQQRTNGSWSAAHDGSQREETRDALVTAVVARALVLTKASDSKHQDSISRALAYLRKQSEQIDEPYLIAAYSLVASAVGQTSEASKANERLRRLVHSESGASYWALETNTPFYGWGAAGRVETTALVLQALMNNRVAEGEKLEVGALVFILRNKDRYGVWFSSQATVNVLEAILSFLKAQANSSSSTNASSVELILNGQPFKTLVLLSNDKMFAPQVVELSSAIKAGVNRLELLTTGSTKTASLQLVGSYHVPWATAEPNDKLANSETLKLQTSFDKMNAKVMEEITCRVKVERVNFRGYGMLLAEIGLPPGADVDRASLDTAMRASNWSIGQYDVLPDRVVVYLWPPAGGTEFSFKFRPRIAMTAKSASSSVYDYYNPEAKAVVAPGTFVVR